MLRKMVQLHGLGACVATAAAAAAATPSQDMKAGWGSYTYAPSAGGQSSCISGPLSVAITATNTKLLVGEPANQTVVTEIIQELTQSNPTITTTSNGGTQVISGTYNIDATFCFPSNPNAWSNVHTVQLLTHGIGLEKSYWDIGPGYSYVDAAVSAGYATLAYNRLGVGKSDHPDPIQVVQAAPDVEIQHGLTQMLRQGKLSSKVFTKIVATGHSYGSIVVLAQTAKYPTDVDAIVLTGFVNQVTYLPQTVLANNPAIAAQANPSKWGNLPYGYLVHDTTISYQLPFWRFPYFDNNIFTAQYNARDTYTIGQQFTLPSIYTVSPSFTGPVDVVVGQHDYPFCHGDCNYPADQAAATRPVLFPASNAAGSQSYIVPNAGHIINGHYEAQQAYSQINAFLKANTL